jgi:hypothetical protein
MMLFNSMGMGAFPKGWGALHSRMSLVRLTLSVQMNLLSLSKDLEFNSWFCVLVIQEKLGLTISSLGSRKLW